MVVQSIRRRRSFHWVVAVLAGVAASVPARAAGEIALACSFDDGTKVEWEIDSNRVVQDGNVAGDIGVVLITDMTISWEVSQWVALSWFGVKIRIDRRNGSVTRTIVPRIGPPIIKNSSGICNKIPLGNRAIP